MPNENARAKNVGLTLIVCGGRDYTDQARVFEILDRIHSTKGIDTILQGEARGADQLAKLWANANRVTCIGFQADWDNHGKGAGPIRNAEMLKYPGINGVVAFKGGSGTQDMISRAMMAKVTVMNVAAEKGSATMQHQGQYTGADE